MSVEIRDAELADAPQILALVRALAEYEQLSAQVEATLVDVERELFGPNAVARALVAVRGGERVGIAIWFHNYFGRAVRRSSWRARQCSLSAVAKPRRARGQSFHVPVAARALPRGSLRAPRAPRPRHRSRVAVELAGGIATLAAR